MFQNKLRTPESKPAALNEDGGAKGSKPKSLAPPVQQSEAVGLEPTTPNSSFFQPPSLSLPPSGGAIRSIGEKFSVNQTNGTASLSISVGTTPGRGGTSPSLNISYDSGAGNGVFGLGWQADVPAITRSLDKRLPQYIEDGNDADVFVLAGSEDLVPTKTLQGKRWVDDIVSRQVGGVDFSIRRYRPRTEGSYARIERWTASNGATHWRTISRDNITTLFGQDADSQIFDPKDPRIVFSWLACISYDSRGNATMFRYKSEDSVGITLGQFACETNRTAQQRTANRYLKSIKYGNNVSRLVNPDLSAASTSWYFEVIFDYGEHNLDAPTIAEDTPWLLRPDPFSTYRPGFELRTYRLCRRILMFHHFPNEPKVGKDCLVSSYDFVFNHAAPDGHSFLASVSRSGYLRSGSGYSKKSTPPLEFTYSTPMISSKVNDVITDNVPVGLSGNYQFADLDGEGISGILTTIGDAWYYKPNLGNGQFAEIYALPQPSSEKQTFMDLDNDGRMEFVDFDSPFSGYAARTYIVDGDDDADDDWGPITTFKSLPNIPWTDPNLAFVDLNGDGLSDVLITENDVITYYPSLGTQGFAAAKQVHVPFDENAGPRVVLSDPLKTIQVSDMSGDGLLDIVRIRNGAVSYWPNLGYGRFGSKIIMDGVTGFDSEDNFQSERVILADIDGTGTSDIVYVAADGAVRIYFNQCGNGFSQPKTLETFPQVSNLSSIKIVDLLGKGTACLVWSSGLPADAQRPLKYIDLMESKPNLLTTIVNNCGLETKIHYTSSTKFYLLDKALGKPWITRLPFPVQVVEHVESFDYISKNRSANRYAYHDGYYDGTEREFRGFGMVEKWDTEEFSSLGGTWPEAANDLAISNTPPILTKTWYHNGAYVGQRNLETLFRKDYFREPGLTESQVLSIRTLPDNSILDEVFVNGESVPRTLTTNELREAYRALKGSMLRTEVYALDDSSLQSYPYTVSEQVYRVRLLQARGDGRYQYGVFQTFSQESLTFHYERQVYTDSNQKLYMDPRVVHSLILNTDEYGDVLQTASIAYGRRHNDSDTRLNSTDRSKQSQLYATYSNTLVTNAILDRDDDYVLPVPYETMGYDILKLQTSNTELVRIENLRRGIANLDLQTDLPLDDWSGTQATGIGPYRRMLSHSKSLFRANDLSGALPLGTIQSLMIPYESYSLAATDMSLQQAFVSSGKFSSTDLAAVLSGEASFAHGSDGKDPNWWTRSGMAFFSENPNATAQQELSEATNNFFMGKRYRSPFHSTNTPNEAFVTYDPYLLMVQEIRDELGNRKTVGARDIDPTRPLLQAGFDYIVMQPELLMDENRNRSAVVFDQLGNVIATAVMGKPEEQLGDSVDGFKAVSDAATLAFIQNPQSQSRVSILQNATGIVLIDEWAYYRTKATANPQPIVQCALSRETHVSDGPNTRIPCGFSYLDGTGRTIQHKTEAEPDSNGAARWNCSGWTVFNNKGDVIQVYEPFYSLTQAYEPNYRVGVASTKFYDPAGRTLGVLNPDHTWSKTRFDPWKAQTWAGNQTVLLDPKVDVDIGGFFRRLPDPNYLPTWYQQRADGSQGALNKVAAMQAAVFSGLESIVFRDSLGRSFMNLAENIWQRAGETQPTTETLIERKNVDIQGRAHEVTDVLGRIVMKFDYAINGAMLHSSSMDAGETWNLNDISGAQLYSWTSRGYRVRVVHDAQRRPVGSALKLNNDAEIIVAKVVYGESVANPESMNLRGRPYDSYDQAGRKLNVRFDFKGNLIQSQQYLSTKYDDVFDLSTQTFEPDVYVGETAYDAFNRSVFAIIDIQALN
jgi:virulence plasmid B protein/glycosyltransferase TcdB-like subunit of Tc toxinin/glycosyltransferase TcdB-like subunit of Tc toxin